MNVLFCSGRSLQNLLDSQSCTREQFLWCSKSLFRSLQISDSEGGNLNYDIFNAGSNFEDRGDLVLNALEFGVGENVTATQLSVIQAEWGARVSIFDLLLSFSILASFTASAIFCLSGPSNF